MKTQKHEKFCSRNYFVPLCTYLFFGCLFVINTSINPPFCSFYFVPLYCMPERFENISSLRLQSYNIERIYFLPHETLQDLIFFYGSDNSGRHPMCKLSLLTQNKLLKYLELTAIFLSHHQVIQSDPILRVL